MMIRRFVLCRYNFKSSAECTLDSFRNSNQNFIEWGMKTHPSLSSSGRFVRHTRKLGYDSTVKTSKVILIGCREKPLTVVRLASSMPGENSNHVTKEFTKSSQPNSTRVTSEEGLHTDSDSTNNLKLIERLVTKVPGAVQPYIKLMRIDRPIGTWLLYWPCGWSIAMSADAGSLPSLEMLSLFAIGAFVMRGAGCTINDLWDRDIDKLVIRTRNRPLVNGSISTLDAVIFLMGQLGVGLLVLLQLNTYCVVLGASSLGLVVAYPLMKRVTYWPQLVLGLAFNWGALLGWAAIHGSVNWSVCLPLYLAGTSWTIFYDTVYAHQDKKDDMRIGIKSTAIKFGNSTKLWLSGFGATMIGGLLISGAQSGIGWPYYASVALVSSHLGYQVYNLNIDNPADCASTFISNKHVGSILFLGIVLGMLSKSKDIKGKPENSPLK